MQTDIKPIIEAALFAAQRPLKVDHIQALFPEASLPSRQEIRDVLKQLQEDYKPRGIELIQVASGYRFQIQSQYAPWIRRLSGQRNPRYSRALLETLAIIAYRQPITRGEIESIRGVSVSSNIIKTLMEYQWIRILAYKDSPGKPALYGTTRGFLDHFNLKNLSQLPSLAELKELPDLEQTDLFEAEDEHPNMITIPSAHSEPNNETN